ncbi:MAG: ATP-binding cassette domain-containing protein [Alphaproteobacteria bacterium]|nr:ATP-binding cassette domain-containing protein [Alphaproteobacteria bacterium]MBO6626782.1 ATP-binding cassette domain-containing protein [Alphaproteobacteria bacterium]MDF1627645.1 ABC transporter transmembrane domain-containing protein [Parvibaculaceae bacterium]
MKMTTGNTRQTAQLKAKLQSALASLKIFIAGGRDAKFNAFLPQNSSPLSRPVLVGSITINFFALATPLALLQVYDRIIPNQAIETLTLLVFGLIGIMLIDAVFRYARSCLIIWHAMQLDHALNVTLVDRFLDTPSLEFEKETPGGYMDKLGAIDTLRDFEGGQSRLLMLDLPFVAVFLTLIAVIGGSLVYVPIALFAILVVVTALSGSALRKVLNDRWAFDDRRYSFIVETLNGIPAIKSMAMEPQIQRRYERLLKTGASATYRTIELGGIAQSFGAVFAGVTMVSVVAVGAMLVIDGSISMGSLAACTLLSGRTIQPLLKGLSLWTQLQSVDVAREKASSLFDLKPQSGNAVEPVSRLAGLIELKNLSFRYGAGEPDIISNVSVKIQPGEMISLTGIDNSGKSTLVRLISGVLKPSQGQVMIDGMEASGPHHQELSNWIAYVPPHPVVFQGTILENLAMFRTGDAIDNARLAARAIELEEEIHRLPDGYDTKVNQGIAEQLPMGFLQRITIARALAMKPQVMIFDEANNSLCAKGDAAVMKALGVLKGGPTIIAVTHRPSLMRLADRRFVMADGVLSQDMDAGQAENPNATPSQSDNHMVAS